MPVFPRQSGSSSYEKVLTNSVNGGRIIATRSVRGHTARWQVASGAGRIGARTAPDHLFLQVERKRAEGPWQGLAEKPVAVSVSAGGAGNVWFGSGVVAGVAGAA